MRTTADVPGGGLKICPHEWETISPFDCATHPASTRWRLHSIPDCSGVFSGCVDEVTDPERGEDAEDVYIPPPIRSRELFRRKRFCLHYDRQDATLYSGSTGVTSIFRR